MGNCFSGAPQNLIAQNDGGEKEFHSRFIEEDILGEGEFGQVRLCHRIGRDYSPDSSAPYACKTLRKGAVFKHNTLYTPIKPEILQGEINILRTLGGKHFCLDLVAIFETPKALFMVTEFCAGGEMMEYVANRKEDLRTEDVSRISFQLFDAINHCARSGVIHRDIKPENCMFQDATLNAELRLIDFGSGTLGASYSGFGDPELHTTFAGSAFYISPEMFQRTYTYKTDVWSAGAAIYVLVAGYPGDKLQKAFNILQTNKNRNLKDLPNIPNEMPDTFYEMLEMALTFRHKSRPSAAEILKCDFIQFHMEYGEGISLMDVAAAAASPLPPKANGTGTGSLRTASVSLHGSVSRHGVFLGFKQFERSLTALLASLLTKKDLEQLTEILKQRVEKRKEEDRKAKALVAEETASENLVESQGLDQDKQLSVIQVRELKSIIRDDLGNHQAIAAMEKLPGGNTFDGFSYHIYLLRDFARDPLGTTMSSNGRRMAGGSFRQGSFRGSFSAVRRGSGNSIKSTGNRTGNRISRSKSEAFMPRKSGISTGFE